MIWSLAKILTFVVLVAALAFGAGLLNDATLNFRLAFGGLELTLGPLQAVVLAVVSIAVLWVLFKVAGFIIALVRFLLGEETAISRYFDRNHERKGYQALADGMMALASGEGRVAMSKAAKAEKHLRQPELTNLVTAQAAEMVGDRAKAEDVYKRLVRSDRTRFVGVRGLMKQQLDKGETVTALKLAEKAFAIKPRHVETQDTLLSLQAQTEDWAGARRTLGAKLKYGALPRDVHKRRDAVLALTEAREHLIDGEEEAARDRAIAANRQSPQLIPAAVLAAEAYVHRGKPRNASNVIKKIWATRPHPDLAAAFAAIAPDETPEQRIKRFRVLTKSNPDHAESRLVMAELFIAAEDFPEARKSLGELAEVNPTARALAIMAAVERGAGVDDAVVRGWLTKAVSASRGPQWVCNSCDTVHDEWQPLCGHCQSFDTLAWVTPKTSGVAMPAGTAMLPVIVGADDTTDSVTEAEVLDEPETVDVTPSSAP